MIDLRSDLLSRPTPAMRRAMDEASTQPTAFELREDPIERRLEARAAELLGKEDALFCPTCTMCNQIAINVTCRPGEAIVGEASSHPITSEAGAPAALSGVTARRIAGRLGRIDPAELEAAVAAGSPQTPCASLILTENTHVHSGGAVVPLDDLRKIREIATRHGIPVHLDGSRIWNAAARLGVSAREIASTADTVAVSLNKGLGAPLGGIVAGSRDFIRRAVRVRQMLGGGWRPANIPAAAGIVALDEMIGRIGDDHLTALRIARGVNALNGLRVDDEQVQTNIVFVRVERPGLQTADLIERLAAHGVRSSATASGAIRLVTYYEIGPPEADTTVEAFRAALAEFD